MKDFSNKYIFVFSIIMVAIVATVLSLVATLLKPAQDKNYELEKKKSILESMGVFAERNDIEKLYNTYIVEGVVVDVNGKIVSGKEAFDIDMDVELKKAKEDMSLPIFKAKTDTGKDLFIVPVRGTGLWGPIWGYLSFESDMNTVYGVMFDHESETPGLGAELNTTDFESRFAGKTIFDDDKFVSIGVVKANVPRDEAHNVDAISGGTMTSLGVASMIDKCLSLYLPYLEANRK